jgi:hypothetical protein
MGKILFPKYFPTCPADGSDFVVPGYTAVLTSTLAETMKLFWRPKKIKVSGSYSQYEDTGYIRDCVTPANFELIIKSPYGSEEEMICEPVLNWVVASANNIENIDDCFDWGGNPLYYGDPLNSFYTFNSFEIIPAYGSTLQSCNSGVLIKQLYPVEREEAGPFDWVPIDIAGVQYQMATYVNESGFGYLSASVEVTEWWSFGGTYNTATGAPL